MCSVGAGPQSSSKNGSRTYSEQVNVMIAIEEGFITKIAVHEKR